MPRYQIEDPAGKAPEHLKNRGKTFSKTFSVVRSTVDTSKIATVCEEANCPNRTECWSGGTATFMLMGDTCTRGCKFCSVKTSRDPGPLNPKEPQNLAKALYDWDVNYIVLTSVNRDDLPDGGSKHLARCIQAVKKEHPEMKIEILIPDFEGKIKSLENIIHVEPEVIAHNIETVERLTSMVRDRRAKYNQTLEVLANIKKLNSDIFSKSSIMVGLSETKDEVIQTMKDLRSVNVDFLTIGQYMRPTLKHLPVKEYVTKKVFDEYKKIGLDLGFKYVASKPLVRSSYRAGEYFIENLIDNKQKK